MKGLENVFVWKYSDRWVADSTLVIALILVNILIFRPLYRNVVRFVLRKDSISLFLGGSRTPTPRTSTPTRITTPVNLPLGQLPPRTSS